MDEPLTYASQKPRYKSVLSLCLDEVETTFIYIIQGVLVFFMVNLIKYTHGIFFISKLSLTRFEWSLSQFWYSQKYGFNEIIISIKWVIQSGIWPQLITLNTPSQLGIIPPACQVSHYHVSSLIISIHLLLITSYLLIFPAHLLNIIESKRRIIFSSKGSVSYYHLFIEILARISLSDLLLKINVSGATTRYYRWGVIFMTRIIIKENIIMENIST